MGIAINGAYIDETKNVIIGGDLVTAIAIGGYLPYYLKPSSTDVLPTSVFFKTLEGVNNLGKGKTYHLIAFITPANVTDKTVTWSSSPSGKVTIDADGVMNVLSGATAGIVRITATTANGLTYTTVMSIT
jgi:hypothetical protein